MGAANAMIMARPANALDRRYLQAVVFMTKVLTTYLGFVIVMLLAPIGAAASHTAASCRSVPIDANNNTGRSAHVLKLFFSENVPPSPLSANPQPTEA